MLVRVVISWSQIDRNFTVNISIEIYLPSNSARRNTELMWEYRANEKGRAYKDKHSLAKITPDLHLRRHQRETFDHSIFCVTIFGTRALQKSMNFYRYPGFNLLVQELREVLKF